MRNYKNIKVYILLFSWLLIFAHEIIPHSHFETEGCHHVADLIHTENHHDTGGNDHFRSMCDDFHSCAIAGFMFQKFSNDENFIVPAYKSHSSLIIPSVRIEIHFTQNHFTDDPSGTVPLRAPPIA